MTQIVNNPFCSAIIRDFDTSIQAEGIFPLESSQQENLVPAEERRDPVPSLQSIAARNLHEVFESGQLGALSEEINIYSSHFKLLLNTASTFEQWIRVVEFARNGDFANYSEEITRSAQEILTRIDTEDFHLGVELNREDPLFAYKRLIQIVAQKAFLQALGEDKEQTVIDLKNTQIDVLARSSSKLQTKANKVVRFAGNFFANPVVKTILSLIIFLLAYHYTKSVSRFFQVNYLPRISNFMINHLSPKVIRYATKAYDYRYRLWLLGAFFSMLRSLLNHFTREMNNIFVKMLNLILRAIEEISLLPIRLCLAIVALPWRVSTYFGSRCPRYSVIAGQALQQKANASREAILIIEKEEVTHIFYQIVIENTSPLSLWGKMTRKISFVASRLHFWRREPQPVRA